MKNFFIFLFLCLIISGLSAQSPYFIDFEIEIDYGYNEIIQGDQANSFLELSDSNPYVDHLSLNFGPSIKMGRQLNNKLTFLTGVRYHRLSFVAQVLEFKFPNQHDETLPLRNYSSRVEFSKFTIPLTLSYKIFSMDHVDFVTEFGLLHSFSRKFTLHQNYISWLDENVTFQSTTFNFHYHFGALAGLTNIVNISPDVRLLTSFGFNMYFDTNLQNIYQRDLMAPYFRIGMRHLI